MKRFSEGDQVRAHLPDETDPDHGRFHGRIGEVIEILEDDAVLETGNQRDNTLYRVEFEDGELANFRWRDLRPSSYD